MTNVKQIWKYMEYEKLYNFLGTSEKAEILFNYCLLVENARQATLQFIQKPYLEAFLSQTEALFKKLELPLHFVYLETGQVIIFNPITGSITPQEMKDMFDPVDDDIKIGKVLGMGCVGNIREITRQEISYGIDIEFDYKERTIRPYSEVCPDLRLEYAKEKFAAFNKVAKKLGLNLVCRVLEVQVKKMQAREIAVITSDVFGEDSKEEPRHTPSFTPVSQNVPRSAPRSSSITPAIKSKTPSLSKLKSLR